MATDCLNCPLRGKPIFSPMTEGELSFMRSFKSGEMSVEAGTTVLMEGASSPQLFTVLDGMGVRSKTLPDGRRQIINFILPGDFLGLQSAVLSAMRHGCVATTPMTLCVFRRADLWELFRNQPHRAYDITWLAAVEEHFLGENLTAIGQLSALERVARSFVKIYTRAAAVDVAESGICPLPYTQKDLADALGLSLVHTNKTLKKLRDRQVASWRDGRLAIHDEQRLRQIAALAPREETVERPLI